MLKDGIDSVVGKRDPFMCRIASLFLLQRLKGSMSGDKRDFKNIETRAVFNKLSEDGTLVLKHVGVGN
jgi:hypothetical protein